MVEISFLHLKTRRVEDTLPTLIERSLTRGWPTNSARLDGRSADLASRRAAFAESVVAALSAINLLQRAYDEAYVDWNKNILLNLFVIREVGGGCRK